MTKKQMIFFKHAKSMAEMSSFPRVHIGCVVTCGNKILSTGFNSTKTSPLQKKYNQYRDFDTNAKISGLEHSIHAEMMAMKQLEYSGVDFSKCEIWVYREKSDGSLGMSRPCAACLQRMKDLGVRVTHYTTDDGYADEEIIY